MRIINVYQVVRKQSYTVCDRITNIKMFYLCSVDVYNYSYIYIYIYQYNFMTLPSRSFNHPFSNHKFEAYLAYRHYKCKLSITTSIVFLGKSFAKYFLSHTFNGLIVQYLYIYIYIYLISQDDNIRDTSCLQRF